MTESLIKVETKEAPTAVGPYSQGVKVPYPGGALLYVSGQLPMDPITNKFVEGDIRVMTRRVLDNIAAILTEGGSSFSQVIKVEVFLSDMNNFKGMNEIYTEYFNGPVKPARQAIGVAALPLGALVEISCIALAINLDVCGRA